MRGKAILALIFAASVSYGGWAELWGSLIPRSTVRTLPSPYWFYDFQNSDVSDSSGNGRNGLTRGSGDITYKTNSTSGNVYLYSSSSQGIYAYTNMPQATNGTISMWAYGISRYQWWLFFYFLNNAANVSPLSLISDNANKTCRFNLNPSGGYLQAVFTGATNYPSAANWAYITTTWTLAEACFYVNGVLVDKDTTPSGVYSPEAWSTNRILVYPGYGYSIDKVAYYDQTLLSNDVMFLWQSQQASNVLFGAGL